MVISVVVLNFLIVNFRSQLRYFFVFSIKLSLDSGLFILLDDLNLVLEMLNVSLELVSLLFLNQNFFRWNDLVAEFFVLLIWIFIADAESSKHTILTSRVKILVVVRYSDSLNW